MALSLFAVVSAHPADTPLSQEAEMMGVATYQNHLVAEVIIGVDTHKDQHVAVAIDGRGVRLDEKSRAC